MCVYYKKYLYLLEKNCMCPSFSVHTQKKIVCVKFLCTYKIFSASFAARNFSHIHKRLSASATLFFSVLATEVICIMRNFPLNHSNTNYNKFILYFLMHLRKYQSSYICGKLEDAKRKMECPRT